MPRISVILPCYNVEKWIDRCLTSIVNQTVGLENLEIICVDDCSTDSTVEKLCHWEKKYPENFIIIESEVNARQGQARNIGLQYATGDWIAFIDSDDWVEPNYIERMLQIGADDDYEIICCKSIRDFSTEYTCTYVAADINNAEQSNAGTYSLMESDTGKNNNKESDTGKNNNKEPNAGINKSQEQVYGVTKYVITCDDDRRELIINPPLGYSAWGKLIKKDFLVENELYFPPYLTYEDASWGSLVHLYFTKAVVCEDKLYHYFVNENSTVLSTNSNHHLDCITTQTRLWREYIDRGFMDRFKDELELEHIYSAYLPGMKMLILRYQVPDYNIYLLLRELMLDRIPNYKENPYIKAGRIQEMHLLMLGAMDTPLSKSQFLEFAENIKTIGI